MNMSFRLAVPMLIAGVVSGLFNVTSGLSDLKRLSDAACDAVDVQCRSKLCGEAAAARRGAAAVGLGHAHSVAKLASWPPEACSEDGDVGALRVACGRGGQVPDKQALHSFWEDAVKLLGETDLVKYLHESVPLTGEVGGTTVKIWGHSQDKLGHKGSLAEQERDGYDLATKTQGLRPGDWIADFGGNLGVTAIHYKVRCPGCKVLTVEPSPSNYVMLRLNLLENAPLSDGIAALQGGLAPTPGSMSGTHFFGSSWLSRQEDIFSGSYMKMNMSELAKRTSDRVGPYTAPLLTIPALMEEFGIDQFGLAKLDCEGCEWGVIRHAMEHGTWNQQFRKHFGELHPFCTAEETDVAKCLPRGWSVEEARSMWLRLCAHDDYVFEWGCEEAKFAMLGLEVAAILAKRSGVK